MDERCHQQWPSRGGRLEFASSLVELSKNIDTDDPETMAAFDRVIRSVRADLRPSVDDMATVLVSVVNGVSRIPEDPPEPKKEMISKKRRPPVQVADQRPRSAFADRIREEDETTDEGRESIRRRLRLPRSSVYVDGQGRRRLTNDD